MLHGYVNDRMWRHGVSGDLQVPAHLVARETLAAIGQVAAVINCGAVKLHANDKDDNTCMRFVAR